MPTLLTYPSTSRSTGSITTRASRHYFHHQCTWQRIRPQLTRLLARPRQTKMRRTFSCHMSSSNPWRLPERPERRGTPKDETATTAPFSMPDLLWKLKSCPLQRALSYRVAMVSATLSGGKAVPSSPIMAVAVSAWKKCGDVRQDKWLVKVLPSEARRRCTNWRPHQTNCAWGRRWF